MYKNREKPSASTLNRLKKAKELSGSSCVILSWLDVQYTLFLPFISSGVSLYRTGCLYPSSSLTTLEYLKRYYKKALSEMTPEVEKNTVEIVVSIVYHILSSFLLTTPSSAPMREVILPAEKRTVREIERKGSSSRDSVLRALYVEQPIRSITNITTCVWILHPFHLRSIQQFTICTCRFLRSGLNCSSPTQW